MQTLKIQNESNILIVSLNRINNKNAINFLMIKELINLYKKVKKDKNIRALILTGENHNFSSGIDLKDLSNKKNIKKIFWEFIKPSKSIFQKVTLNLKKLPIPVICAIEGYCFGAAFQLALACDIRIATSNTKFSIMEAKWGLVPDMGITITAQQLIPIDILKELTFTARIFDSNYAVKYNIITHIDDHPLEYAIKLSKEIINNSPDSITGIKNIYNILSEMKNYKLIWNEKKWQFKMIFLSKNQKISIKRNKNKDNIDYLPRK